ncbi:AraC family transcriptional regulator [Nonomuraea sp. NPDC050153]|uniref:AraC family transcriptional regulator n=1 Tax=Nonomuraea sp. NPDC050153 TaxID=3364359 RepID=UPI003796E3E1
MDVLSDVVALMRTGRPTSVRVSWRAPWGKEFPPVPGSAGFQVVLRGSCWLIPRDGDPVPLSVGDVVFFPHGGGYGLADGPGTPLAAPICNPYLETELFASTVVGGDGAETVTLCCGYQLDPTRIHPILGGLPDVIHLPATLGHHPELRAAVELLAGEIDNPRPGADTVVTSLLEVLQLYVLRAWFELESGACSESGWAAALADPAIGRALDAIHRAPADRWTVESLGAHAGLSRAGFARRFTALVGQPPLAYLTWWRLATAARILREAPDNSVAEVAQQVGYGSEFAFGTAFKRQYGLAPGRYRRQVCEGARTAS